MIEIRNMIDARKNVSIFSEFDVFDSKQILFLRDTCKMSYAVDKENIGA